MERVFFGYKIWIHLRGPLRQSLECTYTKIIISSSTQPLGQFGQEPEASQATGMALVSCILGKILGVVCHCFSPHKDIFFLFGARAHQWARASSFTKFLDYTQRRATVCRTPLDEWSACRRDLYLTTHNTHNRQASMHPAGFEPTISAGERPKTYPLDRAATGTDCAIHWYIIT